MTAFDAGVRRAHSSAVVVRQLDENDVEDYWQLRLRGFREEPELFGSSHEELAGRALAEVERDLRGGNVVVGAFAPALVGIVGLHREPRRKRRHRAILWGMYVGREARGSGVGRALLDEIIRVARATEGLEQIILTVMAHNAAAIALYRRFGFEVYGHAPRAMLLDGRAFDEELMRLDLRPAG